MPKFIFGGFLGALKRATSGFPLFVLVVSDWNKSCSQALLTSPFGICGLRAYRRIQKQQQTGIRERTIGGMSGGRMWTHVWSGQRAFGFGADWSDRRRAGVYIHAFKKGGHA